MAMTGVVHSMNPRRGMVAIETEGHGFTIIEVTDAEDFEVGDVVKWPNNTACGSEKYENVTKGKTASVYVQNHWVSPQDLRQQLLL